jgi:U3 small nucleolar RNA-associated protein 14
LTESEVTKREDEELQGQELTMEEIKARRDALRYQRELMFRAEAKAKRISKIKSKTYRKLARKRAAKEGGGEIDLEDLERLDPEAAAAEREKLERNRARERATLRHGAKSGRWARETGGDGDNLEERRRAKEDMLDIKERLQKKIMGHGDDSSSGDDDDDSGDEEEDEDAIRAKAFNQLTALDKAGQEGKGGKKGLMEMAFMKKAQDREMKRVAEDEKQARIDIERYGRDSDEEDGDSDEGGGDDAVMERVGGNEGRMVFAPSVVSPSLSTSIKIVLTPLASRRSRNWDPERHHCFFRRRDHSRHHCGPAIQISPIATRSRVKPLAYIDPFFRSIT